MANFLCRTEIECSTGRRKQCLSCFSLGTPQLGPAFLRKLVVNIQNSLTHLVISFVKLFGSHNHVLVGQQSESSQRLRLKDTSTFAPVSIFRQVFATFACMPNTLTYPREAAIEELDENVNESVAPPFAFFPSARLPESQRRKPGGDEGCHCGAAGDPHTCYRYCIVARICLDYPQGNSLQGRREER
jgi:hypothetical protein